MLIPVVLAGGSGTRLWPLSRQQHPKQFLKLFGDHTMLQQTLLRLKGIAELGDPIVVCNDDHRFTVAEQLLEIGAKASIILEPVARNTAPAIAIAALQAEKIAPGATLLILPADHLIKDIAAFHISINTAVEAAANGNLVTFGVLPSRPETGYGYIEVESGQLSADNKAKNAQLIKVKQFVEKPDLTTAESYVSSGRFLWNGGMFVFKASAYLSALDEHIPECHSCAEHAFNSSKVDLDFIRLDKASFSDCPNISIDYAVMEKSKKIVCVALDAQWSDVGCWRSYWEASEKDQHGNTAYGDTIAIKTTNTLIYTQDKLVSTIGLDNVLVINTPDAVLVVHKDYAQHVKEVITYLDGEKRNEHLTHRKVNRPWGSYDSVDYGERFQVKRIIVKPGASLSLQMHHHRAEHWIVVKGTALVQRGQEEVLLSENESTYIPLGVKHRLKNPGKLPLELIEVQSGGYLGEDDIVRFDDTYGRS